ncbi:MAG: glycosyltransferase [Actinomycetota bacterium]|nr:glycosyltransferase [Actinomycetota bacterium]
MSERPTAESVFIIATRNRPDELIETVASLCAQTVLPAELCIVDSSDDTPARERIEAMSNDVGLKLSYHHPAPRGLTVQRNFGIDRTNGDPVFLIDDDVYLAPDCHAECLAEYARWGPELGGVRASAINPVDSSRPAKLWRKLFGIGGWWPENSGKLRAGFWIEGISSSSGVRKTDCFVGYFMSFRREVFEHERFDEALSGYGHKEDIDFTYRVSRRYTLVQTPTAKCEHMKTQTARMPAFHLQRMNLGNQFYLHRKNMPQDFRHRAALWWGLLGLFILNVGRALKHNDHGLVTGMIVGAFEQARGRGLIDPARQRDEKGLKGSRGVSR